MASGHKDDWGELNLEMQKYIEASFANKKLMYYRAMKRIKELEKMFNIQLVS